MATRLNEDIRRRLTKALIIHRYTPDVVALADDFGKLADQCYNALYSKKTREQMDEVPLGWLPTTSSLKYQFGDITNIASLSFAGTSMLEFETPCHLSFDALDERRREAEHRLVQNRHAGSGVVEVFDANHRLSMKFTVLRHRRDELNEQAEQCRHTVRATLAKFTVVDKLVKEWEEIAPFVTEITGSRPLVPAVPVDELNAALNLKKAA